MSSKYTFNFKLIPSLIFFLFFCLFIRLGFWQLDRADEKNLLNDAYQARQAAGTVNLNLEENINSFDFLWSKARVEGTFYLDKNILIDNQIYNQTAGFNILTPFKIKNSSWSLLVNRGWHPNLEGRHLLPTIEDRGYLSEIQGHIVKFPVAGIKLGEENIEAINANMIRLQRIDLDEMNQFYSANFLPYILFLDPLVDNELISNYSLPAPDSEKNYGYAFQWFAFAITLLIIYFGLGIKRRNESNH